MSSYLPFSVAPGGANGMRMVSAGALKVNCEKFAGDFASVTAISLDDRPLESSSRVLVTVVGRAANQDIQWNAAHNSVGEHWGHGPTIAERIPTTITLAGSAHRKIFALAPDGSHKRAIRPDTDDEVTFHVEPQDQTLHYEIVEE